MKKLSVLLIAVLLLVQAGLVSAAVAKKRVVIRQVTGQVTAVDAAAKTLSVKGRKGEVQLSATAKTKGVALDKLKTGERVTVRYRVVNTKKEVVGIKMAKALKKRVKKAAKKTAAAAPAPAAAPASTQRPPVTGC